MKNDKKTTVCCVIGNPIAHSLSPVMHNAGYQALGLDYVYVPFEVYDLKNTVSGIKALGIKGVSVTIPHKVEIMQYLDDIDEKARKLGAVNTLIHRDGKLIGYNTDSQGAIRALKEKTKLKRKQVLLVGGGGAALAIALGLKKEGAIVTIANRTVEKAKKIATKIDGSFGDLSLCNNLDSTEIIINATSVGMHHGGVEPLKGESVIPQDALHNKLIVFDIVYNPKETKLIKDALARGLRVVYGYKMLLYQGVAQFEMFTGEKAPVTVMEKALLKALNK